MTLVQDGSAAAATGAGGACVPDMVEEHVRRRPTAAAVDAADGRIDYAALSARAGLCARELRRRGIRPGEPVAVRMTPSAAGVGALLGVLRSGGVLVPLDPVQPPLRQREITGLAGVRLTLSEGAGTEPYAVTDNGNAPRTLGATPGAAYVIHTSGSTGTPKGVVCTHAALANVAHAQRTVFGITPGDRVAQLAPWCVDAFLFEITLALTAGACLHVATPDDRYPGPPLERFLTRTRATAAVITPSGLRALRPEQVPGLHLVVSAGEALLPGPARTWAAGRRLVNAYGVTEGTIWTSYAELDDETLGRYDGTAGHDDGTAGHDDGTAGHDDGTAGHGDETAGSGNSVPLGRPIPGCSLTVLDRQLRPVPPGTPGEAYIGGAGLAAGYLDHDELTAERFPATPTGRAFRTGDIVVRDAAGGLRFVGRDDEQVKLGGVRIELGEVRHVLSRHPTVHDCTVRRDGPRLVAYVVPRQDAAVDRYALTEWLEQRLPIQMVPSLYVPMAALPLTPWGKLDVTALPAPDKEVAAQQDRTSTPGTATESWLTALAATLLGVPAVSPRDDLFLIGMTSVTMARLLRQVIEDLGVDLDPVDVFENPTPAELATVLDERGAERT
ncbi:non-ribosomal peptide synthetase [Streptomyces sp. NPDC059788]|uniref:non-ribosomal peptide synthetase n=1 Tax=Streptomyces sp. NPDC059788 TaxID=3346948 RepID=UPI003658505E